MNCSRSASKRSSRRSPGRTRSSRCAQSGRTRPSDRSASASYPNPNPKPNPHPNPHQVELGQLRLGSVLPPRAQRGARLAAAAVLAQERVAARRVRVRAPATAIQRPAAAWHDALVSDAPALRVSQRRVSGVDGRVQVGRAKEREAALARQPAARTAVWHACDNERCLCEDRLTLVDIAAGEEAAAAARKLPNGDSRRRRRRRRWRSVDAQRGMRPATRCAGDASN